MTQNLNSKENSDNIIDINDDKNKVYENMLFVDKEDQVEDFMQTNLYGHLPAREELGVRDFQLFVIHTHLSYILT
jgi:hypothetical protein